MKKYNRRGMILIFIAVIAIYVNKVLADQKMNCVDTSQVGNVHVNWDLTGTHSGNPNLRVSFSESRGAPFISTVILREKYQIVWYNRDPDNDGYITADNLGGLLRASFTDSGNKPVLLFNNNWQYNTQVEGFSGEKDKWTLFRDGKCVIMNCQLEVGAEPPLRNLESVHDRHQASLQAE